MYWFSSARRQVPGACVWVCLCLYASVCAVCCCCCCGSPSILESFSSFFSFCSFPVTPRWLDSCWLEWACTHEPPPLWPTCRLWAGSWPAGSSSYASPCWDWRVPWSTIKWCSSSYPFCLTKLWSTRPCHRTVEVKAIARIRLNLAIWKLISGR